MTIRCPQCSETQARTKLRQPFQLSLGFMLLAFIGGGVGGLFYGLGQESKFKCGQCGGIFFSRTAVSLVFFVLCVLTYTAVAALIGYAAWTAWRGH